MKIKTATVHTYVERFNRVWPNAEPESSIEVPLKGLLTATLCELHNAVLRSDLPEVTRLSYNRSYFILRSTPGWYDDERIVVYNHVYLPGVKHPGVIECEYSFGPRAAGSVDKLQQEAALYSSQAMMLILTGIKPTSLWRRGVFAPSQEWTSFSTSRSIAFSANQD